MIKTDVLPATVHNALMGLIKARSAEAEDIAHLKAAEKDYADSKAKREAAEKKFIEEVRTHLSKVGSDGAVNRIIRNGVMYSVSNPGFGGKDYVVIEPVKIIE